MALPLPPPGPDHYAARRARWITTAPHHPPIDTHPSHSRLHRLLSTPDTHTDHIWHRGVDQVWNAFGKGNKLKHPLPMSLVIKVVHAAWRRDPETWPEDAVVPDSDDPPDNNPSTEPP
ncbi:hypothetical protein JVU11DRAFT_1674 [Chiua virens]|nr:hypothetical protein JVU11DRAFT_1674 [Chiua virens]